MFDVATFLMRWAFLSNLLSNVAEIQTFPQHRQPNQIHSQDSYYHHHHQQQPQQQRHVPPPPPHEASHSYAQQRQHHEQSHQQQQHQQQPHHRHDPEDHWRNQCLQTILSYPPGSHRLLMADAYRVELVQKLLQKLTSAQECIRWHRFAEYQRNRHRQRIKESLADTMEATKTTESEGKNRPTEQDLDPDADLEILSAMQSDIAVNDESESTNHNASTTATANNDNDDPISDEVPEPLPADILNHGQEDLPPMPDITLSAARQRLQQIREYLPQLVSAVLKSPGPVDPSIANPIQQLRQFLLSRCSQDPSWGIELCWLLEADVGRAWKALLEHPQQTGRRLLVILPAEKAEVLAKIGYEKAAAFDLLQDAEHATAYGYNTAMVDPYNESNEWQTMEQGSMPPEPRLPSSLSQRRCAHFGDTMHFIDRLTKLSLDLRRVPAPDRESRLFEGLSEMNRRIRRRMVTKGEMSLDMEDHYGPNDWPHVEDLNIGMLQHSIHLPLVPQSGAWPRGEANDGPDVPSRENLDTARILNIVVPESRLLSSRERCPFLVQLEVMDTGLEGHDARLYSNSGSSSVGSTIEEALSMNSMAGGIPNQRQIMNTENEENRSPNIAYNIPQELLSSSPSASLRHDFPRGGSVSDQSHSHEQEEGQPYHSYDQDPHHQQYSHYNQPGHNQNSHYQDHDPSYHEQVAYQDENVAYGFPDPSGATRQYEVEQLHHQMQMRQQTTHQQHEQFAYSNGVHNPFHQERTLSVGSDLLNQVFGTTWSERCQEIKKQSPFGQVEGWRLASFIMKAGEDIRRESLVMQIIAKMNAWFEDEIPTAIRPYMRPYTIMCVGGDAGLVECLSDAKSIDEVKKSTDGFESLRDFFERAFGRPGSPPLDEDSVSFEVAQDNFLRSLVGYSLVCYVLQIKDRHNANILLDRKGHIMHIDFGFVLGDIPKMGKVPFFSERAPFKLSAEFWDVLGGWNFRSGGLGVKFCKMLESAFACASKHADEIATLVETTMMSLDNDARTVRAMANGVRSRLRMRGPPGSKKQKEFIVELVSAARESWGTPIYDLLQRSLNGYE